MSGERLRDIQKDFRSLDLAHYSGFHNRMVSMEHLLVQHFGENSDVAIAWKMAVKEFDEIIEAKRLDNSHKAKRVIILGHMSFVIDKVNRMKYFIRDHE